jgi:hypothetical protein
MRGYYGSSSGKPVSSVLAIKSIVLSTFFTKLSRKKRRNTLRTALKSMERMMPILVVRGVSGVD